MSFLNKKIKNRDRKHLRERNSLK